MELSARGHTVTGVRQRPRMGTIQLCFTSDWERSRAVSAVQFFRLDAANSEPCACSSGLPLASSALTIARTTGPGIARTTGMMRLSTNW